MSTTTITERVTNVIEEHAATELIRIQGVQDLHVEGDEGPQQSTVNPSWWPTNHRRIPDYRQPRYHPEWHELTDNSTTMSMIVVVLFAGCHIIAVKPKEVQNLYPRILTN